MTNHLSEQDAAEIKETFEILDVDKDGFIKIKELAELVNRLGERMAVKEADDIIAELKDEMIDYDKFLSLWALKLKEGIDPEEIEDVFKVIDRDQNGLINAGDIFNFLKSMGHSITEEEADEMIMEGDIDGDYLMDKEEFDRMIKFI